MPDEAAGSCDRGMGGNFERYVIHILLSKSSRKGVGQPPSEGSFDKEGTLSPLTREASSKLSLLREGAEVGSSGEVETVVSEGACESVEEAISTMSSWSVVETGFGGGPEAYSLPRHQMGIPDTSSFFGWGS